VGVWRGFGDWPTGKSSGAPDGQSIYSQAKHGPLPSPIVNNKEHFMNLQFVDQLIP